MSRKFSYMIVPVIREIYCEYLITLKEWMCLSNTIANYSSLRVSVDIIGKSQTFKWYESIPGKINNEVRKTG